MQSAGKPDWQASYRGIALYGTIWILETDRHFFYATGVLAESILDDHRPEISRERSADFHLHQKAYRIGLLNQSGNLGGMGPQGHHRSAPAAGFRRRVFKG
jgi:hypothetical protein